MPERIFYERLVIPNFFVSKWTHFEDKWTRKRRWMGANKQDDQWSGQNRVMTAFRVLWRAIVRGVTCMSEFPLVDWEELRR